MEVVPSLLFTLVLLVFLLLIEHGRETTPGPRRHPAREVIEASIATVGLLAVWFIRFDLLWLSGWQSAYLVFCLVVPVVFEWGIRRRGLSAIGLRWPAPGRALYLSIIIICFYVTVRLVFPLLAGTKFQLETQNLLTRVLVFPFLEEMLFRGVIQTRLEAGLGPRWGWLLGGLLFGFFHYLVQHLLPGNPVTASNLAGLAFLTVLGMVLGAIRTRTGSLLPGWLIHLVHNFSPFAA